MSVDFEQDLKQDHFWQVFFPILFPDVAFQDAREDIARIKRLCNIRGGEVLDQACGPGRYSVPMAEKGFELTAVDRSSYLISRARAYAEEQSAKLDIIQWDMRDFERPERFDLVLNMFTSLGYFEEHEDNVEVLRKAYVSLKPGACLLLDVLGKEILARVFQSREVRPLAPDHYVIFEREVASDWSQISNRWTYVGEKKESFEFRHWVYSALELKQMCEAAGFEHIEVYGNLSGADYDHHAERLLILARKQEA
jgi:SAM-dependent methyltransferase